MNHHLLGRTGVSVSQLCLGAMMFGAWGNPDHDESIRIIHTALDAGINFIDTADVYAQGESEQIVGKAIKGRRDDIILATKFHGAMGDDPNRQGSSRRWIIRAVEDSLRRLDTDWIDLYQVHRPRTDTDIEETLGALTDLVRQGKIRYIGASTFPASQIVEAQWVARDRGYQRFVTEQPAYSMLVRRIEDDILPTCQRHGMGVLSYSPLTGGWLSGRWRKDSGQQASSRASRLPERFDLSQPANQRKLDAVEALAQLADDTGITLIQMAIAFVLNHPGITSAIIGPRTMDQLEGQLAAADVVLGTRTSWTGSTRSSHPAPPSTPSTTPSSTGSRRGRRRSGCTSSSRRRCPSGAVNSSTTAGVQVDQRGLQVVPAGLELEQEHDDERRDRQRHRDAPEHPPVARAVEPRGLEQLPWAGPGRTGAAGRCRTPSRTGSSPHSGTQVPSSPESFQIR